jgi:hypothetical protein
VRDESRWRSASAGTAIRLRGSRHVGLALTADLELASVRADTRGLASGRVLSAMKMIWGGLVGVEGTWAPVAQVPLALELGAAIGGLTAVAKEQVVDGYTPFENAFTADHLRLGITWRGAAAHR